MSGTSTIKTRTRTRWHALFWVVALVSWALPSYSQVIHLQEDFATGTGTTPPTGWTQNAIVGAAAARWNFSNAGGRAAAAPFSSPFATYDADFINIQTTTNVALESPVMDLTGVTNVQLSYDHYYRHVSGDSAVVEAFNGTSWVRVAFYVANTSATQGQPTAVTVDLSSVLANVPNARIRFRMRSTWGWWWTVDNIRVFTPPPGELQVLSVVAPVTACGLDLENVRVQIRNNGSATVPDHDIQLVVNGVPVATETVNTPIDPGATITYDFTTLYDFSTPGTYNITVYTMLPSDPNNANDTARRTIQNIPIISSFPYNEGFESGAGGWEAGGTLSSWALGTPAKSVINSAANGANSWVTGGLTTGTYNANESSRVLSPCFDFTSLVNPEVRLNIWWNSEFSWDGAVLQSTINGGTTWQNVGTFNAPNNWYNDNDINGGTNGGPGGQLIGWTGRNSTNNGSGGWRLAKHALTGLAGQPSVRFRVAFAADGTGQDNGFAFDDFLIQEKPAEELKAIAVLGPASSCALGSSEVLSIRIANLGSGSFTSVPVKYSINGGTVVSEVADFSADPLNPGDTQVYVFTTTANFSAINQYNVVAYTDMPNDDDRANDTARVTIFKDKVISSFPNLETFDTAGHGWRSGGVNSSWALGTPAKTPINSANSAPNSWITGLTAAHNNNEQSWVLSPCYDLSSLVQPRVTMRVWWNSQAGFDGAVLQYSIDNGATWVRVGASGDPNNWYNNAAITGNPGGQAQGWSGRASSSNGSGGWVTAINTVPALAGQSSVRFRVAFGSNATTTDNGFAFDNFQVDDAPPVELALRRILAPVSGCGLSANETVTIRVTNFGNAPQSNIPVSYQINGGTVINEVVPGPINVGDSATYSFTTLADLSVPNTYNLTTFVSQAGDANHSNDTLRSVIQALPLINSFPHTEDFESGRGGWVSGGALSTWAFGTPAKSVINSAGSGVNSWVTGGLTTGTYAANENSFVLSPCYDLSSLTNPQVTLKIWWNCEFSWDGAVLQSSINNGTSWQNVGALNDPNNWYNDGDINGSPGGQLIGWSGRNSTNNGSAGWRVAKNNLTGLGGQSNVRFRIAFGADNSGQDNGFAFDDFTVSELAANDIAVVSVDSLETDCPYTNSETVFITVANKGTAAQNNVPVSFQVGSGVVVTENIPTIAAGDTIAFAFTTTADFNAPGTYSIRAWSSNPGDADITNDSSAVLTFRHLFHDFTTGDYTQGFEVNAGEDVDDWIIYNNNLDATTWGLTLTNPFGGTIAARYGTNTTNNADDWVFSRCFDFEAGVQYELSFWSRAGSATLPETMHVFLGTAQIPSAFTTSLVELNNFVNTSYVQTVVPFTVPADGIYHIGFHALSAANSSGINLDDIRIRIVYPENFAITAIEQPNSDCSLSAAEQVVARYTNLGSTAVSNIPVTLMVNGLAVATETIAGPIAAGATGTYTFTATANLSTAGSYFITVYSDLAADANRSNDTLTKVVESKPVISGFPYMENFENGRGFWASGGTNSSWAFGTPGKPVINSAGSGLNSWVTGGLGSGRYNILENSYVESPCFNFSSLTAPRISLKIWYNSEFSWDGAALFSSIDNGATWQRVGNLNDPDNWYNDGTIGGAPGGSQIGWTGRAATSNGSGGWVVAKNNLTSLAGQANVKFRVYFGSDDSVEDDGFAFDDVMIDEPPAIDLGVSAILPNRGNFCAGISQNVSVVITNYGTASQSNIPVTVDVSGSTSASIPGLFSGSIAPGASDTLLIGSLPLPAGQFVLTAYTTMPGDGLHTNDTTVSGSLNVYNTPAITALANQAVCFGNAATLGYAPVSGVRHTWFDSQSGGALLVTSDTLVTPALTVADTFYVEAASVAIASGGATSTAIGAGGNATFAGSYQIFTVTSATQLVSVDVYPSGATDFVVQVQSNTGAPLVSRPFTVTGPGPVTININANLAPGSYRLTLSTLNSGGLFRNTAGASYPYPVGTDLVITGNNFDPGYWYFFYNWQVETRLCPSARVAIPVAVNPLPSKNLGPDQTVCEGVNVSLDAGNAGASYLWSDGSTNQTLSFVAAGAGVQSYSVVVTSAQGCVERDTVEVTVNPTPSVNLGADVNVCIGETVSLDAGNAGATYLWSDGSTSQTLSFVANAVGVQTFFVTASLGSCEDSDTIVVTINDNPTQNLGADQTVCEGETVSLDAGNAGASFLWSDGSTNQTLSFVAAGVGVQSYSVIVTNAAGCISNDTVEVTVNASPSVNLGADQAVCVGETVSLDAGNAGATYLWSDGSTSQTLSFVATTAGIQSISVIVSLGSCVDHDTVLVDVSGAPVVNLGPDQTICFGTSATFQAPAGAASYLWSDGSTGAAITAAASGIYWVDVTNSAGCTTRDSVELTVGSQLIADAGLDQLITCGGSLTLTASASGGAGSYDFIWLNGGPASAGYLINNAGTYIVEVTDAAGCVDYDTVVVSLTGSTLSASLPATASVCFGSSVELAVVVSGGTAPFSYSWNGGAATSDSTFDASNAGSVSVVVTDAAGCSVSAATTVSVLQAPVANIGPDATLCVGDALSLDAGNAGATYVWSTGQNSQTVNLSFGAAVVDSMIIVRVINANGCEDSDTLLVTVNAGPSVNLGTNVNVCEGESVLLDAGNPGATYLWSDGSTSQTLSFTASGVGVQSYSVIVTSASGCVGHDTVLVTVNPHPSVSLGNDTTICQGASLTLDAGAGNSYLWTGGTTGQTLVVSTAGTYIVVVTNASGCETADTIVVSVTDPTGITVQVPGTVDVGQSFSVSASGGTSYAWSFGADATPATAVGANPTGISYSTPGTKSVTVTVTAGACLFQFNETIVVTTPSSVNNDLAQSLTVYPNPNDGRFTLNFTLPTADDVTVEVFDVTGKNVFHNQLKGISQYQEAIELLGVAKGIYNLKVTTSNGSITKKLFVQ